MIHTYAIDPEALVECCDRRTYNLMLSEFGLGTPRILFEIPKFSTWKRRVWDAASRATLREMEKKRLEELMNHLGERRTRHAVAYDGAVTWLENALTAHAKGALSSIVVPSNGSRTPPCMTTDDLGDAKSPGWARPRGLVFHREKAGLAAQVATMVASANELHLVDPYWGPENPKHQRILVALCSHVGPACKVVVHTGTKSELPHFETCAEGLQKRLAVPVEYRRHDHKHTEFHNRYLLTEHGGVVLGRGVESGKAAEEDDVMLMDRDQYLTRWSAWQTWPEVDRVSPSSPHGDPS